MPVPGRSEPGSRPAACPRSSRPRTTRSSPRPGCAVGERLLVHGAAGGVGTAGGAARRRRGRLRDRHGAQRPELARGRARARRRRRDRPGGLRRARPLRRRPRARRRARTSPPTSRRSRPAGASSSSASGAGAKAELQPRRAHGPSARPCAPRRCARDRSRRRPLTARAMERHVLPLFERGALRVPIAATLPARRASPTPTSASAPAASSARSSWRSCRERRRAALAGDRRPRLGRRGRPVPPQRRGRVAAHGDAHERHRVRRGQPRRIRAGGRSSCCGSSARARTSRSRLRVTDGAEAYACAGFYDVHQARIAGAVEYWLAPGAETPSADRRR